MSYSWAINQCDELVKITTLNYYHVSCQNLMNLLWLFMLIFLCCLLIIKNLIIITFIKGSVTVKWCYFTHSLGCSHCSNIFLYPISFVLDFFCTDICSLHWNCYYNKLLYKPQTAFFISLNPSFLKNLFIFIPLK